MTRIVVVGSANVDLVAQAPHIPQPGETVLGWGFVMAMGGKGANQAVGAARLGGNVTFLARIGNDSFGDQCLAAYQHEGINTHFIQRDQHEPTGVALIEIDQEGENSIMVASGANMKLTPADVEMAASIFQNADILLVQLEVPVETVVASVRLARKNHVRVILNPAPARQLPAELLQMVDVITPNRIEAMQLSGMPVADAEQLSHERLAKSVLGLGPSSAVITMGAQGALAAGSWGWVEVPSFPVKPVDTTAAGDAFNAGLAFSLGRGDTLELAARYACACGALAATKLGAQPSLPDAASVERLLQGK